MDIFITQNSYYFVHRHFLNLFLKNNSYIIYVREIKKGIFRKYYDFLLNFGLLNTFFSCIMEFVYFTLLSRKVGELKISITDDADLNSFLENKLKTGNFNRVFSIGCPCKINAEFQKKYKINIYNLHGGIIPYQIGRFSPIKSLRKGHSYLGASLHLISKVFDEGTIVSQDYFQTNNKYIIANYNKVLKISSSLLGCFFNGTIKKIPLDVFKDLEKSNRPD